jgi:hypothetical protein
MRISELIESRVFNRRELDAPLKDSDTIRVFHGASDVETVLYAVTHGLTGNTRADRRYSYEFNNNPMGLFVTVDFKTAKEFGDYIIEFHSRVRDLSAPVWPGGSYTVQGGITGIFNSDQERDAAILKQREKYKNSDDPNISNSDRPELAFTLFGMGERQALFNGDLNRNSIKRIWVNSKPGYRGEKYIKYTVLEFLSKFKKTGIDTRYGNVKSLDKRSERDIKHSEYKIKPRDNITFRELVDLLVKEYKMDFDSIADILVNNLDYIRRAVWSERQYNQVINDPEFIAYKNKN